MDNPYRILLWQIIISTVMVTLIVTVALLFNGCVDDKAMSKTETMTVILQPAYEELKKVCPLAVVGAESIRLDPDIEVRARCRNIERAFVKVQAIQENEVINAGGEPCSKNCTTSQ